MNENKHGDTYKVEMLRRMLTHETDAKDAEIQLSAFFGINTEENSPFDEEDSKENSHAFVMKYGYPFVELMDVESRNYALEALVAEYEDAMDCNVAENDTWQSVITEYFAREREATE